MYIEIPESEVIPILWPISWHEWQSKSGQYIMGEMSFEAPLEMRRCDIEQQVDDLFFSGRLGFPENDVFNSAVFTTNNTAQVCYTRILDTEPEVLTNSALNFS